MKKSLLLLTILFILTIPLNFFACNSKVKTKYVQNIDNSVGELSIFTYDGKSESKNLLRNYGHSFLSFKNTSNEYIKIGNYLVSENETISFSTWSINSHFGVWYDVEANYIENYDKYNGRISITTLVDKNDIKNMNDFILKNDTWQPLKNCSYFSLNIWNIIASEQEKFDTPLFYSPAFVAKQIKTFESYELNKNINAKSTFGYYDNKFNVFCFEGEYYE